MCHASPQAVEDEIAHEMSMTEEARRVFTEKLIAMNTTLSDNLRACREVQGIGERGSITTPILAGGGEVVVMEEGERYRLKELARCPARRRSGETVTVYSSLQQHTSNLSDLNEASCFAPLFSSPPPPLQISSSIKMTTRSSMRTSSPCRSSPKTCKVRSPPLLLSYHTMAQSAP